MVTVPGTLREQPEPLATVAGQGRVAGLRDGVPSGMFRRVNKTIRRTASSVVRVVPLVHRVLLVRPVGFVRENRPLRLAGWGGER